MKHLVALLAMLALVGCGSSPEEPAGVAEGPPPLQEAEDGNLTLYVSNQSFERENVDILLFIDGRPAVDDDFAVEGQHNWVEFRFNLPDGEHALRAETIAGEAVLEETFTVAGKRWAVVNYWCCDDTSDPKFTLDVSAEPIAFA